MLKKRYLFLIMLVCLFAISAVSAEKITNETNDVLSIDNEDSIGLNESEILNVKPDGTFTYLTNEIANVNGELNLNRNYVYDDENENYLRSSDTKTFNVNNITPKINIENDTLFINEKLDIEFPKDATGNISVILYCYLYNGCLENGKYTITIPEFGVGNYALGIYYEGDDKYDSYELRKNVYVTYLKKDLNLTIDFPSEIKVGNEGGSNEILYINNLPYNATGLLTLYVDGKKVENQEQMIRDLKKVIEFKCPYLKEGIHKWEVKFAGDIRYNNASVFGSFKVKNFAEPVGDAIVIMNGSIVYGNEHFKFLKEAKTSETTYRIYNLIVDGDEYFILTDINGGYGLFNNPCYKIFDPSEYILYDKFYYRTNNGVVSDVISAYDYVIIDGVYYEFLGRPKEYYGNEKEDYYYEVIDNVCYKGGFYHLYKAIENVDYNIINSEYYTLNGEKIPVRENYVWYVINNGSCDKRDNLYWNHWAFSVGYDYIKVNNDYYRLIKGQFNEKTEDYNLYALINGKIYHVIDGEIGLPIDAKYIIDAPSVTKYYHGPERFVVTLKDLNGKVISNAEIKISLNGFNHLITTNDKGVALMDLNLDSDTYDAIVIFDDVSVTAKVTINKIGTDFTVENMNKKLLIEFVDDVSGTVSVDMGNQIFTSTVKNAKASFSISNIAPGSYNAKITYSGDKNHNSKSISKEIIIESENITYYGVALKNKQSLIDIDSNDIKWNIKNISIYDDAFRRVVNYSFSTFKLDNIEYAIVTCSMDPRYSNIGIKFNPEEYELYGGIYYKSHNGVITDVIDEYEVLDNVYYNYVGIGSFDHGDNPGFYCLVNKTCYYVSGQLGMGMAFFYETKEGIDYKIVDGKYYTLDGKIIENFMDEDRIQEGRTIAIINSTFYDIYDDFECRPHLSWTIGYKYVKVNNNYYRLFFGNYNEQLQSLNKYALIDGKLYHVINGSIGLPIDAKYIIDAPDVTKYYHGPERFVVTLKDLNGKVISNAQIKITINGQTSSRTTGSNGQTSMGINLNSGKYTAEVEYGAMKVYSTVTVKPTVSGNNVTKIYRNDTQYYATFRDSNGNLLKNTDVNFNINGVFYTRKTNDQGVAKMNINLLPGEYIITAMNPVSTEQSGNLIKVLPSIITYDLTKYYKNASRLTFKLLDNQGRPVGAGVSATININGVFYTRQTNASGYINMNVNLNPGTYIATLDYNGLMASSTVKVLPILEAKDVVMKYRDGTKFEAKLLDGQGRPFAGQTITFNINGVMYNRITDASGVARLNLNLMAGEYIITSMYENGATIANKVTIRS